MHSWAFYWFFGKLKFIHVYLYAEMLPSFKIEYDLRGKCAKKTPNFHFELPFYEIQEKKEEGGYFACQNVLYSKDAEEKQRKCLFIHHFLNTLFNQFQEISTPLQMETIWAHANSLTPIRHWNVIQLTLRFCYCTKTGHAIEFTLFFPIRKWVICLLTSYSARFI